MKALLLALACAAFLPLSSSCIGRKVDDLALFSPAALTWPAVEQDFERGLADGVEDGDLVADSAAILRMEGHALEEALDNRDRDALRGVPWPAMEEWASRGIQDKLSDGEIGEGVAMSLRGQLQDFSTTLNRLRASL